MPRPIVANLQKKFQFNLSIGKINKIKFSGRRKYHNFTYALSDRIVTFIA
jgi:hypothetical protein